MAEQSGDPFARAALASGNPSAGGTTATGPRRFGEVGSAMNSIFGAPRMPSAADAPSYALPVMVPQRRRRRGGRVLGGITLTALAAVAGVATGVTVLDRGMIDELDSPPVRTATRSQAAPVAAQPVPQANLAVAPAPTPQAVAVAATAAPVASPSPRTVVETIERAPPQQQARRYRVAGDYGRNAACEGRRGGASIVCLAEQLDGADRDLVDAYASAAEAGVPRGYLVAVNRRWERARNRAQDDPAQALRSYEDMADELWAARRRALRDDD